VLYPVTTPLVGQAAIVKHRYRGTTISELFRAEADLWRFAGVLASVTAGRILFLGWSVVWLPVVQFAVLVGLLLAIGAFYHRTGRADSLARMACGIAIWLVLAFVCQTATYAFATTGTIFRDDELRAMDATLGFSWTTWAAWLSWHPVLHRILAVVYPLHLLEAAMAVLLLYLQSRRSGASFVRAFAFAYIVSLVGLIAVPALGNIPEARSVPVRLALQHGTYTTFDIVQSTGLISMPSFHAVISVLVPIASWPYRRVRWPVLTLNAVMLLATVSEGGHYLVDVLAGAGVALAAARFASMPAVSGVHPRDDTLESY